MPNVKSMSSFITRLDSAYISVHQDRCVLVRNRNADCLRCAAACTSGCISFDGEQLHVNPDICIGCGTCATVCPTCALEARNPTDDTLIAECLNALASSSAGSVLIACGNATEALTGGDAGAAGADAQAVPDSQAVYVECLGRVEESLLTTLAANGAKTVKLAHGNCQACTHKTGRETCESVLECERELMDAWGADIDFELIQAGENFSKPDEAPKTQLQDNPDENFSSEPAQAAPDAGLYVIQVTDDGTQPHFIPERRERLLNALTEIGEPTDTELYGRHWAHVEIDTDICKGCRMCTVFCPSGALARYDESEDDFGIEHRSGDCANCGTCAAICPTKAIKIVSGVRATQLFDGSVERIQMVPRSAHRGTAHSVWHTIEDQTKTTQVYER